MQQLYGNTSNIFITPYGTFNNGTIKAMSQLGIRILSAATFSESEFDKNDSIINANNRTTGIATPAQGTTVNETNYQTLIVVLT